MKPNNLMDGERVPAVTILLLIDLSSSNYLLASEHATGTRQS